MYHAAGGTADTARLEDYISAVRLRKWVVLGLTLAGLFGALSLTANRTTNYEATSRVALYPTPVGSVDARLEPPNLEKEREILASVDVAKLVKEQTGVTEGPGALLSQLSVKFVPKSDVLVASYTSPDQKQAAVVVNAFVDVYRARREAAATNLYQGTIEAAGIQIEEASAAAAELRQQVAAANPEAKANLQTELGAAQSRVRQLTVDRAKAESQLSALEQSPTAVVLASADAPTSPLGIPRSFIVLAGLLVGLAIGAVTAFILERLDTTARDESDVAMALGTSVMGSLPLLGFRQRSGSASLVMLSSGGSNRVSAAREAFRRLRSSLQFLNASTDVSSVMVTSSSPGEGKSMTSANLSISLAQNGSRVVLVSGDLRRPTLEKLFDMDNSGPGLAEYLNNTADLKITPAPGIENLWLIPSGRPPGNPGELLSSDRFEQVIKELESQYVDYIIVDTPPVLSTADAVSAARYVDGVLVVVDTQTTETTDLLQVKSDLERSGSKLLGAIMNRRRFSRQGLFKRNKYAYYNVQER